MTPTLRNCRLLDPDRGCAPQWLQFPLRQRLAMDDSSIPRLPETNLGTALPIDQYLKSGKQLIRMVIRRY
jgi:hypothetical protein